MPGTLGRFVWHELMTPDPGAAIDFYKKVTGWGTQQWEGADYTMWMAGEIPVGGIMNVPEGWPHGPSWMVYLESPDVDATMKKVQERGGSIMKQPGAVPGVGRFGFASDPQGAFFGVITQETEMPAEGDPRPLDFSWHELICQDLEQQRKFYFDVFDWMDKGDFDMGEMGLYRMFGRDRFTYGGMFVMPGATGAPSRWLPYIYVDSADAAAERATAAGGKVVNGPMEVPGGDRVATIVDPQGATISVHSKPK